MPSRASVYRLRWDGKMTATPINSTSSHNRDHQGIGTALGKGTRIAGDAARVQVSSSVGKSNAA